MRKARIEAAQRVGAALFEAEKAIDLALSRTAELAQLMPTARNDANLSAVVGQEAFELAVATVTSLTGARRNIVETHKQLAATRDEIGLREMALGGMMEKPAPSARLSVVQAA